MKALNLGLLWSPSGSWRRRSGCADERLPRAAGPLRHGTVWGKQLALSMLADAGLGNVESKEIDSDPFNAYFVTGK
jgi:hypothetical protein